MMIHENLFNHYERKTEVYQKLQDDYLRDQKHSRWYMTAFVLLLVATGFIYNSAWKHVLFLGAGFALVQYLIIFIELSNRNYLMHAIDWLEASDCSKSKPQQTEE